MTVETESGIMRAMDDATEVRPLPAEPEPGPEGPAWQGTWGLDHPPQHPRLRDVWPGWRERAPKALIALAVLVALVPLVGIPAHWAATRHAVLYLDAAFILVCLALLT